MFLLAFLISSLLGLSVDTATFVDLFWRLLLEWIVGNLSQEFSLLTSTTLLKNSLQPLLLGELDFRFHFNESRIEYIIECEHWANDFSFSDMVLMMAVFIWSSAQRYLISSFRDSAWSQSPTDWCFSSSDFFTTNICLRKKDFNASISAFNRMIWSLKSHTEVLLSIELEVSSCYRAIDSCSFERWISYGVSVRMLCFREETGSISLFKIWVSFDVVSTLSFKLTLFTTL